MRGLWLALEAWADDPPAFVLLENVPRIATRGAHLLDQIEALLERYGYATALCDYLSQPGFRREVLRILGHGESVHALQRAIHHGRAVAKRGRRHDELVAQSGALALLTNITMAWNTHHMDRVHKAWRQEEANKIAVEMLPRITPVRYEHINFRGVFAFPIGPYRERLLGTSVEQSARAA